MFTNFLINDYENIKYVYLLCIKMRLTIWQIAYCREDNIENRMTAVHLTLVFVKLKSTLEKK